MFKDKRGYVYSKKRVNGRVATTYIGPGTKGGAAHEHLQREAKQKAHKQEQRQREQYFCSQINSSLAGVDAEMLLLHDSCEQLVSMALIQAGYHQHAHSEWRKKRTPKLFDTVSDMTTKEMKLNEGNMRRTTMTAEAAVNNKSGEELEGRSLGTASLNESTSTMLINKENTTQDVGQMEGQGSRVGNRAGLERPLPAPKLLLTREELKDLTAKAAHDEMAVAELLSLLDSIGKADAYFDAVRDAASSARHSLIKLCCPNDKLAAMGLERRLKAMQQELAGPDATALEKQLAERIALCWLQVHYFESMFALNATDAAVSTLYQSRVDAAHKRQLSAIKALAQVRKLQIPVLQFNLAEQQVNIGHVGNIRGHAQADPQDNTG